MNTNRFHLSRLTSVLVGVLACIVLNACDNFQGGADIKNQIADEINYSNAKSVTVTISCKEEFGTVIPGTSYTEKLGYDHEIQFIPNTDRYIILNPETIFEAVSRTNQNTSRSDCVTLSPITQSEDDIKNGVYRIIAKVTKDTDDLLLRVAAIEKPIVTSVFPENTIAGVSCANDIYVKFNKPVAISDFTEVDDAGNITAFKNIEIYCGTQNLLDDEDDAPYFSYPEILDNGFTLKIPVNKNHLIFEDNTSNEVKSITVSIKTSAIKDAADSLNFGSDTTWTYRVNNSSEILPRIGILTGAKEITSYDGETETTVLDNMIYDDWDWDYEDYSVFENNHINDTVLISIEAQGTYPVDKICVKETLKYYKDGNDADIYYGEKTFSPICSPLDAYSWKTDEFSYKLHSESDGLVELEIYYLDSLQNKSDTKKISVIRDTAFTTSIKGYGLDTARQVCSDGKDHVSFGFKNIWEEFYCGGESELVSIYKVEWYEEDEGEENAREIEAQASGYYSIAGVSEFYNVKCNPKVNNYFIIYAQDTVGNLSSQIVCIPKLPFIFTLTKATYYNDRIRQETYNCNYSASEQVISGYYKDGVSAQFTHNGHYTNFVQGWLTVRANSELDYAKGYAWLKFFEWQICGCYCNPVYYSETQTETVELPAGIEFTMRAADRNSGKRIIHANFVLSDSQKQALAAEDKTEEEFYNPSYEYLIKVDYQASLDGSGIKYIYYEPGDIPVLSKSMCKLYPCVRTASGEVITGSNYVECDPTQVDNIPPAWAVSSGYKVPCPNGAKVYGIPTDASGIKNQNGIVTLKFFYLPNNGVETVQTKTEEELFSYISSNNCKTISYDLNNLPSYLLFPFDGLLQDWYTLFVYVEDNSSLKNYAFFSFAHSNIVSNRIPSLRLENENLLMENLYEHPSFAVEIYDENTWKNYSTSLKWTAIGPVLIAAYGENYSRVNPNTFDLTTFDQNGHLDEHFYRGTPNSLPGKFTRYSAITNNGNYVPFYFYYSYYMNPSAYPCKNKSINTNVIGGIQINTDIPVLVHTFYCSRNLGDSDENSYKQWLSHGIETGIQVEEEIFTYTNENFREIPAGAYYTTVAHFADGTVLMTPILQK